MKEIRKILKFMEGYKGIYVLAMLSIILSQLVVIMSPPLIIMTTVDSIIGEIPIDSNLLGNIVKSLGGRDYLRENIWIIGLLLVIVAILRGVFMYFRNTLASKASEHTAKILGMSSMIKFKDYLMNIM